MKNEKLNDCIYEEVCFEKDSKSSDGYCFGCAGSAGKQCNEVMTRRYKI